MSKLLSRLQHTSNHNIDNPNNVCDNVEKNLNFVSSGERARYTQQVLLDLYQRKLPTELVNLMLSYMTFIDQLAAVINEEVRILQIETKWNEIQLLDLLNNKNRDYTR